MLKILDREYGSMVRARARVAGGLRGWLRGRGFAELASSGVEETEAVMKPG